MWLLMTVNVSGSCAHAVGVTRVQKFSHSLTFPTQWAKRSRPDLLGIWYLWRNAVCSAGRWQTDEAAASSVVNQFATCNLTHLHPPPPVCSPLSGSDSGWCRSALGWCKLNMVQWESFMEGVSWRQRHETWDHCDAQPEFLPVDKKINEGRKWFKLSEQEFSNISNIFYVLSREFHFMFNCWVNLVCGPQAFMDPFKSFPNKIMIIKSLEINSMRIHYQILYLRWAFNPSSDLTGRSRLRHINRISQYLTWGLTWKSF